MHKIVLRHSSILTAGLVLIAAWASAHFGCSSLKVIDQRLFLASFAFGVLFSQNRKVQRKTPWRLKETAALALAIIVVTAAGCGGYGGSKVINRGTTSILVSAQSGVVSHTPTVKVTVQ